MCVYMYMYINTYKNMTFFNWDFMKGFSPSLAWRVQHCSSRPVMCLFKILTLDTGMQKHSPPVPTGLKVPLPPTPPEEKPVASSSQHHVQLFVPDTSMTKVFASQKKKRGGDLIQNLHLFFVSLWLHCMVLPHRVDGDWLFVLRCEGIHSVHVHVFPQSKLFGRFGLDIW